ncbi:hypothetical protein EST38_g6928 [Candolleomyces aberdarensis]|uniref:Spc7 kinetochore protein domain-containing protein n=1 Tax=Candolleomyces aberdarensis TaxID=2316362 RepID=A0A4Q2DGN1_9AGAR|nr:hypothetical protein EST38_g6928 [Candolleomyces aberdarensis]
MVVTKDSPNRRRSIAVAGSHGQSAAIPRRRRAYSVAPRTSLSPQAKARRLLVPRKSILKTSFTPDDAEPQPTQSTQSTQGNLDDNDVTQSMDFTQDFRAKIHDNASRKSFGRRVSFAEHAHVRVFQIPDKNQPAPQSSPSQTSSDPDPLPAPVSNENDYPQANSARRRRSSVRFSEGSDDMDMTSVMDLPPPGSAILDEEFDEFGDEGLSEDMDMEVTQVMAGNMARKRSLSMGTGRRDTLPPSAILDMSDDAPSELDQDQTQSSIADDSVISEASEAASDKSQNMEFTIPLNKSLRPPAHEDAVWLALRQATHSGDTPYEPADESLEEDYNNPNHGELELDDAVQRLMRARDSLSLQNQAGDGANLLDNQEDTVSSIGSVESENGGNHTVNLSKVLSRVSMGGNDANSRMSMGYGETTMDESEVYGDIVAMRRQSVAPRQSLLPNASAGPSSTVSQEAPPTVFRPPSPSRQPSAAESSPARPPVKQLTVPSPFSFTAQPTPSTSKQPTNNVTPSKAKPKPTFTAAFAPPSARTSPKKLQKRPLDENEADAEQPTPAKRQALAGKWLDATEPPRTEPPSPPARESAPKPRPLSPSKKSPFQSMGTQQSRQPSTSTAPSSVRKPTGYMARRKSLALAPNPASLASKSPKKPAGRMSLASAPQDAWTRFDKDAHLPKKSVRIQEDEQPEDDQEPPQDEPPAAEERSPSPTPRTPVVRIIEPESPEHGPVESSAAYDREFGEDEDMEISTPLKKTERWRENVEEGLYDEEEVEIPEISIAQFFQMTGIKFMDELTAPRRSIHPSQTPTRQPREPQDIPSSEYVVAMAIDIPQLELYTRVSRDLEAWMEKSKSVFADAEEEAAKITPELFVEYAKADEEGQAELLHQLNFIKINTRGHAKSDWYDWKLKWVEGLKMTADQAFADLESDAKKLEALSAAASEVIPDLEREYEQIMAELEREQAEVAEIEACDQDYLNELKASIAEQNIEVEALKAEVAESNDQLKWLEDRLQETDAQKREIQGSIAKAERILQIQKSSTRAEVFQLKDELESLEELHMVRVIKVSSQVFEYIYDSTFRIVIPCKNFRPVISKITISRLEHTRARAKDDFPKLSALFLECATEVLAEDEDTTVPKVIHKLNDYWTSCAQLRSHLRLLNVKYPIDIDVATSAPSSVPTFRVRATVLFPRVAGKAIVSYIFTLQTFCQWPLSIDSLDCAVDVSYGPLDRGEILKAVVDRLAQATPSDNYLFLDSCIDAQSLYN